MISPPPNPVIFSPHFIPFLAHNFFPSFTPRKVWKTEFYTLIYIFSAHFQKNRVFTYFLFFFSLKRFLARKNPLPVYKLLSLTKRKISTRYLNVAFENRLAFSFGWGGLSCFLSLSILYVLPFNVLSGAAFLWKFPIKIIIKLERVQKKLINK